MLPLIDLFGYFNSLVYMPISNYCSYIYDVIENTYQKGYGVCVICSTFTHVPKPVNI